MLEIIDQVIQLFRQGIPCLFYLITGLYCPGCGGTRAAVFLLHGELWKSLHYHPLVFYVAAVAVLQLSGWAASRMWKRPWLHIKRYEIFTYIGIMITVLNWGWKNYMLVVHGMDLGA